MAKMGDGEPFEFVEVEGEAKWPCPEEMRGLIEVDTVHDGWRLPSEFERGPIGELWHTPEFQSHFVHERDWGANAVAEHLSRLLGLRGYHRVTVARAVMDFNRFPGSSPPGSSHFERLAISEPLSQRLSYDEKAYVLESCYDQISTLMERAIDGKLLKIAIHTYDELNATQTQRPELSLLTRSDSYQRYSRLPYGLFDPLFPDILVESTVDPVLRDRLALTLQKSGINVEHNYPYCQPDGSIEVRSQPWLYFRSVKRHFEKARGNSGRGPGYDKVWEMLLNTNLRRGDGEALSGFLHRFRRPPRGQEELFERALRAYEEIGKYCTSSLEFVEDYRRSPLRSSALAIEVRKDLLWRFENGNPVELLEDNVVRIAEKLAEGIAVYFQEDFGPGKEQLLDLQRSIQSQGSFQPSGI